MAETNEIAARLVKRIRRNVGAYWNDKKSYEAFHARQIALWDEVVGAGSAVDAAVRATLRARLPSAPSAVQP